MSVRCAIALSLLALAGGTSALAQSGVAGPSAGGVPSYMIPSSTSSGVQFISIATTGSSINYTNLDTGVNNYRMVGIPDGMGVYRDADDLANGTFTVLMNHEIGANTSTVRAHGNRGSFVSQWKIRTSDLSVVGGRDLATSVNLYNMTSNSFQNFNSATWMPAYAQGGALGAQGWDTTSANYTAKNGIGRLCSADLAPVSAYSYTDGAGTVYGTTDRIYMNGEEIGDSGRAFGWLATGSEARTAYELPDLADFSWENSVANPLSQRKTIVAGTDDSTPGQVYFYVGDKQTTGNAIERAGLMGGKTYGMSIPSLIGGTQNPETPGFIASSTPFNLVDLSANQRDAGSAFQGVSNAAGVTNFARPEDGAWNPANPSEFFFVTTGATVAGGRASPPASTRLRSPTSPTPPRAAPSPCSGRATTSRRSAAGSPPPPARPPPTRSTTSPPAASGRSSSRKTWATTPASGGCGSTTASPTRSKRSGSATRSTSPAARRAS